MSKATLKHRIGDTVETRTTARQYTHVVVGSVNIDRVKAELDAFEASLPSRIADHLRELQREEKINRAVIKPENFGKKYKNSNGYVCDVDDFAVSLATKMLEYGTAEEQLAEQVECYEKDVARQRANLETIDTAPHVISWHGSADLAEKAANQGRYRNLDCTVEAINGGE